MLAGLDPSPENAGPLLKLLLDTDERTRFWADRSLQSLYDSVTGFDSQRPPSTGNKAIARWYDIVQRRAGNR